MLHYPPDRQMMVLLAEGESDQEAALAVKKLRETLTVSNLSAHPGQVLPGLEICIAIHYI